EIGIWGYIHVTCIRAGFADDHLPGLSLPLHSSVTTIIHGLHLNGKWMHLGKFLDCGQIKGQVAKAILERLGDVRHEGCISTQADMEEKVLPALRKSFRLPPSLSHGLQAVPGTAGQGQVLHPNVPKVNPACLALYKSQRRF